MTSRILSPGHKYSTQTLQSDVRQRPRGFKGQESVDVEVKTVEGDQRSCLSSVDK